ncbi:MAG: ABC transporter substrate-binding protein [Acetobacteraceae bacterium]
MTDRSALLPRRALLRGAALAGAALPLGGPGPARFGRPGDREPNGKPGEGPLHLNQTALCTAAVPIAVDRGIFDKHGLDVGADQFRRLHGRVAGDDRQRHQADAGIGMILRWLKPLEQGFDVKLVAGVHGGCSYLVASRASGITDIPSLRGKRVGISDFASPRQEPLRDHPPESRPGSGQRRGVEAVPRPTC